MTVLMLADLPVGNLEEANRSFQTCFETARKGGTLDQLATECLDLLAAGPSEFAAPYAFAIAARARLHDPAFWSKSPATAASQAWRPKLDLLDWLDKLLSMPAVVNSRHNYYYEIIAGIRNFIVGDMNAAFRYFALAARPSDFHRVVKDDFGYSAGFARTFPSLADLAAARGRQFSRELKFIQPPQGQWTAAFSIWVDLIYAEAFADRWIELLSHACGDRVGLHFHVMFRGAADTVLLDNLMTRARECGLPLAISIEESVVTDRSYFASARFFKGPALLDTLGCTVLFCDADSYITDAAAFANQHLPRIVKEDRLLGFIGKGAYNGYLPWRCFGATWMVVPAADWAKRFFGLTGDAVEYFFNPRERNWWIDQMALEVARNLAIAEGIPANNFQPIQSTLPGILETGRDYKIATISAVPRIKMLLDTGLSYWQAMSRADS